MKIKIESIKEVKSWLANPVPAVFQGIDLTSASEEVASMPLTSCSFLGCEMTTTLRSAAAHADCLILPRDKSLPFDAYSPTVYTAEELFDKFDPSDSLSYKRCLDWIIYDSYIDLVTKQLRPVSADVLLMRRMHDATVAEALDDLISDCMERIVAVMGGHDVGRDDPLYSQIARLALALANKGYMIATGGGPGLMEAANLGGYAAGFSNASEKLDAAIVTLKTAPSYKDADWLKCAFLAKQQMGIPIDSRRSQNLGIPTWFYGHEPPNIFASHIAKYFENSIREEGLLAIAMGGVIFADGNAGTVQEIFQDACQNYYRTYEKKKSPMILLGSQYWNPPTMCFNDPANKRKQAYFLLHKLATEKGFDDYLLVSDDHASIIKFIETHPPVL